MHHQPGGNEPVHDNSLDKYTPKIEAYKPYRLANATNSDIEKARAIVAAAIEEATKHNIARLAKPLRNQYYLKPSTKLSKRGNVEDEVPPLFNVTRDIQAAAALLAEHDAYERVKHNSTLIQRRQNQSKWWLGNIKHSGGWPWGSNKDDYKVCENFNQ